MVGIGTGSVLAVELDELTAGDLGRESVGLADGRAADLYKTSVFVVKGQEGPARGATDFESNAGGRPGGRQVNRAHCVFAEVDGGGSDGGIDSDGQGFVMVDSQTNKAMPMKGEIRQMFEKLSGLEQ